MDDAGLAKQGGTAEAEPFVPDRTEGSLFFSLSAGRRGSGRRGDEMPGFTRGRSPTGQATARPGIVVCMARRAWFLAGPLGHNSRAARMFLQR